MAGVRVQTINPEAVLSFFASYGQPKSLCRLEGLPKPLNKTLFKDAKTFYLLMRYITKYDDYKRRLIGLPLLLTADGYIRCYEMMNIKYESFFSDLIPSIREQFFDEKLFQILRLEATKDDHLCRTFTITDFSKALPSFLPPNIFKTSEEHVKIQILKDILKDSDLKWLDRLWEFLFSRQRRLKSSSIYTLNSLRDTIYPLNDWCLLPVSFQHEEYLFPLQKARSVIDLANQGILQQTLVSCLQKIGIPQPLYRYFSCSSSHDNASKMSSRTYGQILGTLDDACSVVLGLEEVVRLGAIETKLNGTECYSFCHYLANFLNSWEMNLNSIDTIRQLPIFTTMDGRQVPLMTSFAYVIPSGIPTTEMDSWTASRGIIFLKNDKTCRELFKFLGCTILNEFEVYCSYIFEHFEMLSEPAQKVHLRYVRDNLLNESNNPGNQKLKHAALIEALRRLSFMKTSNDSYLSASNFYDNQNEVFKAMQKPDEFPPTPFDSAEWNHFLKKCGMISFVNQAMFCEYAHQIEEKAQMVIDQELINQSRILVKHLFGRDDIADTKFMTRVKNIRFVAPYNLDHHKRILHEGYRKENNNKQTMFICFKNAITPENLDLAWTVETILPQEAEPFNFQRQTIISNLEIQQEVRLETVVRHMNRLSCKWAPEVHMLKPHADIMALVLKECYLFLKSKWDLSSDDFAMSILKATPCIFDSENCLLLRPEQIVLRMRKDEEIRPYLVRNPDELGEFSKLFALIGSTDDDATLDQYCMVLEMIYSAVKDNKLHPNEKEAVCKAVTGLFKLLGKAKSPVMLERQLFLPATDERLRISSEILVNDNHSLIRRMKKFEQPFLIDIKKDCALKLREDELKALIKKLPACYQPQFLTSVVCEEMEENLAQEPSQIAKMLETRLQSEKLREGIMRIALQNIEEPGDAKKQEINDAIDLGLQCLHFIGLDTINTWLVYQGHRIQGSDEEKKYFIKENFISGRRFCMVFVAKELGKDIKKIFYNKIARTIQSFTDNIVPNDKISCLEHILECDEHMIDDMLDEHGVKRNSPLEKLERPFRHRPGQFVPIQMHKLLKQDILLLTVGDYVALETDDPIDLVKCKSESEADHQSDPQEDVSGEDNTQQPTYIMVKILGVCNNECGPNPITYKVDNGKGEITVPAVLLYAFHRTATNASDVHAILQEDCSDARNPVTLDDAKSEIQQMLSDAWTLPEEMHTKYIRRLLSKWHPDANPDNIQLATEATKYIFEEIDKLKNGTLSTLSTQSSSNNFHRDSSYYSGAYYRYISTRVRKHQREQQIFRQNYEQNTRNDTKKWYVRNFIKSFTTSLNPQPAEGRRWLRQAEFDLRAAANDRIGGICPSEEWACFKCFQAAIKALKGARYARDSDSVFGENPREMAKVFCNDELSGWVFQLQQLLTSPSYMQFPTDHNQANIPHDIFSEEIAQRAQQMSQNIVDWCRNYIA